MTVVINGTTGVSGVAGSASAPALIGSDADSGFYINSANEPNASVNGSAVWNAASSFGFKSRIINGAMVIDQRNAGASLTTNGAYCLDRWYFETSNTGNNSVQQSTDAPTGFYNSIKITTNTGGSVSSGSYLDLTQKIEGFNCSDFGWGSASASKVTISFWVKSSVTGTYSVNLRMPLAGTPVGSVQTYTINSANTWEQKSVTFTGNTATALVGTNTNQFSLIFFLASGSTYQTASTDTWVTTGSGYVSSSSQATGMLTTTGATFYITGVMLEKGSTATSFDYRPYGTELVLCQRYYWQVSGVGGSTTGCTIDGLYAASVGNGITFSYMHPVVMRSAPTATTLYNDLLNASSVTVSTSVFGVSVTATGGTSGSGRTAYNFNSSGYVKMSAEL